MTKDRERNNLSLQPTAHFGAFVFGSDIAWQVLVLHPDAVCPEGLPIPILANPTLGKVANPIWFNHYSTGFTLCFTGQVHKFYHGDPAHREGGFHATRSEVESVSVMAAIINAHSKFQHAISYNYPSATDEWIIKLANLCKTIVTEFFKRPHVENEGNLSDEEDDESGSLTPRTEEDEQVDPRDCTGFQDASDIEVEEWDENGLTSTEFRTLSAKAKDTKLGAEERVDAAMMLFGPRRMFFFLTRQ